jgi:GWxTD domain-containing protein
VHGGGHTMSFVWENIKRSLGKVIAAGVLGITCLLAQTENVRPDEGIANLFTEVFALASDQAGKGRVDIYVQVPYPEINFVKERDQYTGRYELTATIYSQEKQQLWQKSQLAELHVKDFSQTISRHFSSLKQFAADVEPGTDEILIQIIDQETKKIESVRRSVHIKNFMNDSLALSDMMIVHRVSREGGRKNIVPNLTGVISKEESSLSLFFEIYNRVPCDSVKLTCRFVNSKREIFGRQTRTEPLTGSRTQVVWKLDSLSVPPDRYVLLVDALGRSSSEKNQILQASVSRVCTIRLKNMPLMISDIDKAIEELVYIAKGNEIDYIKDAATTDDKQKRFIEFWEKHNPTPKEPNNELMEEYYARVDYANKNFGGYMDGWKTDRGMVLIQFGPPQNIERHPFDADNKPYEIWFYYGQNREFIFVDETGFGDYRLQYPQTDLWGRIR